MNKFLIELRRKEPASDPLQFWEQPMPVYPRQAPLAQDLISAPAALAFVERIFSVCGLFNFNFSMNAPAQPYSSINAERI